MPLAILLMMLQNRLAKIEKAEQENDWFTAFVLTASQIEHQGSIKIRNNFISNNIEPAIIDYILEKVYLRHIGEILKIMKIINKKELKIIMKINDQRNFFVHKREHKKPEVGIEAQNKYKQLIAEAKKILRERLLS